VGRLRARVPRWMPRSLPPYCDSLVTNAMRPQVLDPTGLYGFNAGPDRAL